MSNLAQIYSFSKEAYYVGIDFLDIKRAHSFFAHFVTLRAILVPIFLNFSVPKFR